MNQIQMWQLLVDIGLITSVLTLTTRAFKASRLPGILPKTRELEASLRGLIGEAEGAGIQLNDQLLRREQNIQKALTEIQQSEGRISQAIADAETLLSKLNTTRNETIRVIQDLKLGFERGLQTELVRYEERPSHVMTPPQTQIPVERAAQAPQAPHAETPRTERAQVAASSQDFVEQTYPRSNLRQKIEVETFSAPQASTETILNSQSAASSSAPTKAADLKRVYQSAEQLIKEGKAVESVAAQMKLPVEGVRLLAQMIEIEREESTQKQDPNGKIATTDSRLGALASIRRQTSVL